MNHEVADVNSKLNTYRKRMYKPTSRSDLMYMLQNKTKIVTYDELLEYNSFNELMEEFGSCIILYPNRSDPSCGHWCCIFIIPGTDRVEYFDPYGCFLEEPIKEYNDEERSEIEKDENNQDITKKQKFGERRLLEPKLRELLLKSDYVDNLYWNETPFQNVECGANTCGLWNVLRLKNSHLPELEFRKIFFDLPSNSNPPVLPDLVVSSIICSLYPEMCENN